MAKPRTPVQLVERLDNEFSWRRVEFTFLKSLVNKSSGLDETAAIRASVPLLYAHWEGFVKRSACHYAEFLSAQRMTYAQASVSLSGLRAQSYVASLSEIKRKVFTASSLLEKIKGIDDERVDIRLSPYIESVGNLTFDLFEQISLFLNLDIGPYAPFKQLVDDVLLFHRNKIAHGERLEIDANRYVALHDEVLKVLSSFKTDIETAAINKAYRR